MNSSSHIAHPTESATLADLLERVLDKGLVVTGDIRVKLVDIELLTIQIRLLICSVDKAKELGVDWWSHDAVERRQQAQILDAMERMERRLADMEAQSPSHPAPKERAMKDAEEARPQS